MESGNETIRRRIDIMIIANHVYKSFNDIDAVLDVSVSIKNQQVFGLIGTNGAGKSTFLRMVSGVFRPDKGEILVENEKVFENIKAKSEIFYISDEQYFLPNSNAMDMANFYKNFYKNFDIERFKKYLKNFQLDEKRRINTFSKGMKKQLCVLLGICANTKYLLCDETFDGLDPVMRQAVKSIFAGELINRDFTPVIASHNLRELEDICDTIGVLHKGGVLMQKDLEDMKLHIHTIQCVIPDEAKQQELKSRLDLVKTEKRGALLLLTARGERDTILKAVDSFNPVFYEVLPLSLEEIFISETEAIGYDIKKLIF